MILNEPFRDKLLCQVVVCQQVDRQVEGDRSVLRRGQCQTDVTFEFLHRTGQAGVFILEIELDHFLARALPGIGDRDLDVDDLSGISLGAVEDKMRVLKCGIAQP